MINISRKIKKLGLYYFAFLVLAPVFFVLIPTAQKTEAAPERKLDRVKYVDAIHIKLGGQVYTDSNPYDDFRRFEGGDSDCKDAVTMFDSDTGSTFVAGHKLSTGDCAGIANGNDAYARWQAAGSQRVNITDIENAERKDWNVYRRSDDELFVPIGVKGAGCAGDWTKMHFSPGDDNKLWRRRPAGEPNRKPNEYLRDDGNLSDDYTIITNNPTTGFFRIDTRCSVGPLSHTITHDMGRVTIAFNGENVSGEAGKCIPKIYNVEGGGCPEDDPDDPTTGGTTDVDGEGDQNITCEVKWNNPLTWIMCPIFNGMADLTDWMFKSLIEPFLYVSPVNTDPNEPAFQAWSSFRVYANILLIVAMLVIVMGQALGGGLVDAYTAKKVLPKLLAAAILINLSVYAINLMIDITNIIGKGIGNLIYAPFKSSMGSFDLGLGQGGLAAAAGVGGIVAGAGAITSFVGAATVGLGSVAPFVGLFMILPAAIAIMGVFATIVIRQGLILFLIISSPIAFCLYALPNGEQYFKKWWDLLFKTLMMYPIIVIIFCMADVLSITVLKASGNGGTVSGGVAAIVAFVLQFLPLFLIPFAFKLAGGAVASIYGAISSTGKKGLEGIKGSEHNPYSLRNSVRRNYKKAGTRARDNWSNDLNNANVKGWRKQRARLAGMGNQRYDAAMLNKEEKDVQDNTTQTGADDMRFAAGGFVVRKGEATRSRVKLIDPKTGKAGSAYTDKDHVDDTKDRYFNSKGQEITRDFYRKAKSTLGNDIPAVGQSLEYAVRKFENDDDIDNYWQGFTQAAVDMNMSDWEGLGTHNAATYGAKGQHIGLNKTSPKLQRDPATGRVTGVALKDLSTDAAAHKDSVDWLRRNQQQYPQSMQSDETLKTQAHWQKILEDRIIQAQAGGGVASQDDMDHLASIYENTDGQTQVMQSLANAAPGAVTGDPAVSASGATPAAQAILTSMKSQQRLELGAYDAVSGSRSLGIKGQQPGAATTPVGSVTLSQGGAPAVADTSGIKPTPGRFRR